MPGATKLGSCLTDATRGDRARRTVRVLAAMLRSERATQQSSRPFDPVVSLRPPCPRVHLNFGPGSLIVKQSIDAVPRKIFARLAAGTGTISQDGFSQPALGLDPRAGAGFPKRSCSKRTRP